MNYDAQLQKIEDTRQKTFEVIAILDTKLNNEEIDGIQHKILLHEKLLGKTKDEILAYLDVEKEKILSKIKEEEKQKEEQTKQNRNKTKKTITIVVSILLILTIAMIFTSQNGISGFIVKNFNLQDEVLIITNQTIEQQLNYSNITSLSISGTIDKGSANVKLRLENGTELLVANLIATETGETYTLTTDKKIYALSETVNILLTPNTLDTSTYIYHNEISETLNENTYTPLTIGEYKIVTIITDGEQTSRLELNFTVAEETNNEEQEIVSTTIGATNSFTDLCEETCEFGLTSNPILIIEPIDGATVEVTKIKTTIQKENNAPRQVIDLSDIELIEGQEIQIDMSRYFEDADQDTIYYDITSTENVSTNINGNILTLTGITPGDEAANIYATDSTEITTSNEFRIIVISDVLENVTENISEESTVNNTENLSSTIEGNETINLTTELNQTENSTSIISSCDLPLEERPTICFEGEEAKFFKDIVATLTDSIGAPVGRFNRFGNLIIKGELIESSSKQPNNLDFKIGYVETVDYNDNIIITAWIDRNTGDLHLKGKIYEEQQILNAPQYDSYTINNKLGITVAYFDKKTGDLYLRGNLVRSGRV